MSASQNIHYEARYIAELITEAGKHEETLKNIKLSAPVTPVGNGLINIAANTFSKLLTPKTGIHNEIINLSKNYKVQYPPV